MPDTIDVQVFNEGLTVRTKDWAATVVWPLRMETEGGPVLPGLAKDLSPPPDRSCGGWYFQHPGEYVNVDGRFDAALARIAEDPAAYGLTQDQAWFLRTISGPYHWLVDAFQQPPAGPPPRLVSTHTIYDEIRERFRVGWHPLPTVDVRTAHPSIWN